MKNLFVIIGAIYLAMASAMLYASYFAPLSENRSKAYTDYLIASGVALILFKLNDIHNDILKQKK